MLSFRPFLHGALRDKYLPPNDVGEAKPSQTVTWIPLVTEIGTLVLVVTKV